MTGTQKTSDIFSLRNGTGRVIDVVLEPWGDVRQLAPDRKVAITSANGMLDRLELELENDRLVIYGSEGSLLEFTETP